MAVLATTVTVCALAADRLTVKVAVPPSVTVTLLIDSAGNGATSLSVMVPTPGRIGEGGVGRPAQVDAEGLGGFRRRVIDGGDREAPGGGAGREGQRHVVAGGEVTRGRGSAVGGAGDHGDRLRTGCRQADREGGGAALGYRYVVKRYARCAGHWTTICGAICHVTFGDASP